MSLSTAPSSNPVSPSAAESAVCLNCGAAMGGAFCGECGQKRVRPDLTLREFIHETTSELASWEGRIPATLRTLFLRPGLLTLDFLAGRRARWLPPLRVYLICSVAFFLSGPLMEAITHRAARESVRFTLTDNGKTTVTPELRRQIEKGLPARIFGADRLIRAASNSKKLNEVVTASYPKAMFVLLPLFAALTRLAWRRQRPSYPEHLYNALHLHAAWFGILAAATVLAAPFPAERGGTLLAVASLLYMMAYTLLALRRVFGDSWSRTVAKSMGVAVLYGISLMTTSLLMLAYALFRI